MKRVVAICFAISALPLSAQMRHEFRVSPWVGMNYPSVDRIVDDIAEAADKKGQTGIGGVSYGLDIWTGGDLQYGVAFSYNPIFSLEASHTHLIVFIPVNYKVYIRVDELLVTLQLRHWLLPRVYLGGGLGLAFSRTDFATTIQWFVPLAGTELRTYVPTLMATAGLLVLEEKNVRFELVARAEMPAFFLYAGAEPRASLILGTALSYGFR